MFAIVGNVGTPPWPRPHLKSPDANRTIFFGPVTGAAFLRKSPPDRYIFNYRVSYEQQAAAAGKWMAEKRGRQIDPRNIAVFAQGNVGWRPGHLHVGRGGRDRL